MKRIFYIAALAALIAVPSASASSLSISGTKLARYYRVQSVFTVGAPPCVLDGWGTFPYACTEGDLNFVVSKRTPRGWKRIYRDSYVVFTNGFDSLKGSDRNRLYYWLFRDYSFTRRVCRRLRVQVRFVDSFSSTTNPRKTRRWRACYGG